MKQIKVGLAGQPNCGKSTIFNLVSGIEQHIANYPGVTVDKKVGFFKYEDYKVEMVDLPGTYSFSSFSQEEKVAKKFIIDESNPNSKEKSIDIIVNVIDSSNLKRNLYLTFQLLEIGIPVIVVLNMIDIAKNRGLEIDSKKISKMLSCPVVETSGSKSIGGKELMQTIANTFEKKTKYEEFKINYEELEVHIQKIEKLLENSKSHLSKRWLAIKLLEEDPTILEHVGSNIKKRRK